MEVMRLLKKYLTKTKNLLDSKKGHPDWKKLLQNDGAAWQQSLNAAKQGPNILIATSTGALNAVTPIESLLAVALTLRGFQSHIFLCDNLLPACMNSHISQFPGRKIEEFIKHGPRKKLCRKCFLPAYAMYSSLGLQIHKFGDYVTPEEQAIARDLSGSTSCRDIGSFTLEGIAVGEHALAGALRFFASGNLDNEPYAESVLKNYFTASLLTAFAIRTLLESVEFTSSCFNHGIYVPQGIISEVARQKNLPITTWNPAYRKKCFIFSHNDTYHHTMLSEPTELWEDITWTPDLEMETMKYLKSRWHGSQDWIWFHEKPHTELTAISSELGADFSKPSVGMLTNVMWDAQLHYKANAFPNMLDWVLRTIKYFEKRPELQLIIRIHPAEIRGTIPSRQPILDEIYKIFPRLPENIFIIPPESHISTYAAMQECNAVIIYGTKTGVELTSMGIPVIVAGEAWIRNKGITMDARSPDEYFNLLDSLPLKLRMASDVLQKARMYAFHFFFRRMIPISYMQPTDGWPPYRIKISGLDDLLPDKDQGLDIICNGITKGTEFIYPAETYHQQTEPNDK